MDFQLLTHSEKCPCSYCKESSIIQKIISFDITKINWHTIDVFRGLSYVDLLRTSKICDEHKALIIRNLKRIEILCKANIQARQDHGDVLKDRSVEGRQDKFLQLVRDDTKDVAKSLIGK